MINSLNIKQPIFFRNRIITGSLSLSLCLLALATTAQTKPKTKPLPIGNLSPKPYHQPAQFKKDLYAFAADSMEGRGLATEGQNKAAQFLIRRLKSLKIASAPNTTLPYQQLVPAYVSRPSTCEVSINGNLLTERKDYVLYRRFFGQMPDSIFQSLDGKSSKLLYNIGFANADTITTSFAGYGMVTNTYSDLKTVAINGKTVIILDSIPPIAIAYGLKTPEDISANTLNNRIANLLRLGAKHVLVATQQPLKLSMASDMGRRINFKPLDIATYQPNAVIIIKQEIVEKLANLPAGTLSSFIPPVITKKNRSSKANQEGLAVPSMLMVIKVTPQEKYLPSNNIAAWLPMKGSATHTISKDIETVVLSAHYDHLGKSSDGDIFNGADDNGSGSMALLHIAAYLDSLPDRKRNVLLLWLTAEETGLTGSRYYVNNPLIPLAQTVADINIDMMGRQDTIYDRKKRIGNKPITYIYPVGAHKLPGFWLPDYQKTLKRFPDMVQDSLFNSPKDPLRVYYRSDHYNFVQSGIPAMFFFGGLHQDYHATTDDADKIDYELLAKRSTFIADFIINTINSPTLKKLP